MNQIENLLRVMVNGDKEAKITAVAVNLTPTLFTSHLVNGFPRKRIRVYNQSSNLIENSGECYYGYSDDITPSDKSWPIPIHTYAKIAVTVNVDLYFCCQSGETGELRIEEIA
jgi:hypothetical protein